MRKVNFMFTGELLKKKGREDFYYVYTIKDSNTGELLHKGNRLADKPPRTILNSVVKEFSNKYGYEPYKVEFPMWNIG